jgi:catechol-2,3-dioxygenase
LDSASAIPSSLDRSRIVCAFHIRSGLQGENGAKLSVSQAVRQRGEMEEAMTETETKVRARVRLKNSNISRLHHKAYATNDPEATRHFYEDVVGLPLVATWCEQYESSGREVSFCHTFFELMDGGALAFFAFADPEMKEQIRNQAPRPIFDHIALNVDEATQMAIRDRLIKDGRKPEDIRIIDHGYCVSLYTNDPDGNFIEFCRDTASFDEVAEKKKVDAHSELKRWLAGDYRPNNILR